MRLTFIWAILFGTIAGALIVCASSTSSHLLPSVQADEPTPNRPAKTKPATKTPDSTAPSGSASHSLFEKRITPNNPEATLNYLLESGLIDPENPENSTLLLKPTLQVKHGGGQKMVVGDRSYKQFRRFLDDYAATLQGKYKRGEDLPAEDSEVSQVSEIWLKLTGVPKSFDKMLLQVDLYRWENGKWSKQRVATSDRQVFGPQNLWQHSLSLTATSGSAAAKDLKQLRLARGKYLIKIYVDQKGKLQDDFTAVLDEKDLVGQVEVESGWPAGYGSMTVVAFPNK